MDDVPWEVGVGEQTLERWRSAGPVESVIATDGRHGQGRSERMMVPRARRGRSARAATLVRQQPFLESLFRTAKHRSEFPTAGFADLEAIGAWASRFVPWYYNHEHRHSSIRYVSPAQRHDGRDSEILSQRHALYLRARARNPCRWSGHTRDWSRIDVVTLNAEQENVAATTGSDLDKQRLVA